MYKKKTKIKHQKDTYNSITFHGPRVVDQLVIGSTIKALLVILWVQTSIISMCRAWGRVDTHRGIVVVNKSQWILSILAGRHINIA